MASQRNKQNELKIKFLDFGITRIEFQLNEAFIAKKRKPVKFGTLIDGEVIFDKKNLNLTIRLEVRVPETEAMPFRIEVQGKGVFKLSKEPENFEKVAWINCAAIIFPFIRETVADVTRRSGLAPLFIPPINFVRLYEARKKDFKKHKVPKKIVINT